MTPKFKHLLLLFCVFQFVLLKLSINYLYPEHQKPEPPHFQRVLGGSGAPIEKVVTRSAAHDGKIVGDQNAVKYTPNDRPPAIGSQNSQVGHKMVRSARKATARSFTGQGSLLKSDDLAAQRKVLLHNLMIQNHAVKDYSRRILLQEINKKHPNQIRFSNPDSE